MGVLNTGVYKQKLPIDFTDEAFLNHILKSKRTF